MKKNLSVLILTVLTAANLPLFSASGTAGLAFLKIVPVARPAGLGEAFVGLADDTNAVWWNPAGLVNLNKLNCEVTYGALFEDINYQYFAYALPLFKGVLGMNLMLTRYGNIELTKEDATGGLELTNETFTASDSIISAGYGMSLIRNISAGVSIKFIRSTIWNKSTETSAVDFGLLYKLSRLSIGISIKNLGSEIKYIYNTSPLPVLIKLGVAYNISLGKRNNIIALCDFTDDKEISNLIHLGTECNYLIGENTKLSGRIGTKINFAGINKSCGVTIGAGIRYMNFWFDIAWIPYIDLGSTTRVSLGIEF